MENRALMAKKRKRRKRSGPAQYYWPRGKERPAYWGSIAYPCARCDRILTDHASQAVICYGRHRGKAYLSCRVCRHKFTLPTEERP